MPRLSQLDGGKKKSDFVMMWMKGSSKHVFSVLPARLGLPVMPAHTVHWLLVVTKSIPLLFRNY